MESAVSEFPNQFEPKTVEPRLYDQWVKDGLFTADPFFPRPPGRTGILLGYAALRERDIREGIRRLAAALA